MTRRPHRDTWSWQDAVDWLRGHAQSHRDDADYDHDDHYGLATACDRTADLLDAISQIHFMPDPDNESVCVGCYSGWPCATRRILDGGGRR